LLALSLLMITSVQFGWRRGDSGATGTGNLIANPADGGGVWMSDGASRERASAKGGHRDQHVFKTPTGKLVTDGPVRAVA